MMRRNLLEETAATLEFFEQRLRMALNSMWRRVRMACKHMFFRLLHFLRQVREELLAFCRIISRLAIATAKLSLFYIPGVLGWLIGWHAFALMWFITITALGLFYGRRKPLRS